MASPRALTGAAAREAADLARRPFVRASDVGVERAHAAEPRGESDVAHGERRLVEQLLGEVGAARERDLERRRAEVLQEEPAKVAPRHAEAFGQAFDPLFVERPLADEPQAARNDRRRAEPRGRARRRFGPAAKARPESRRFGRGG
jgi:hypothetical protein